MRAIGSADHAGMLAIQCEFVIRNVIGKRRSLGEDLIGLAKLACDHQRVAKRSVSDGKLRWRVVFLGQRNEVTRQCDGPWDRLTHQAGVPGKAAGRESSRGSVEFVCQVLRSKGALLHTRCAKTLNGNQWYGEVERQIELARVTLLAWRQLCEQI